MRKFALLLTCLASIASGCSSLSGTGDLEYIPGEGAVLQVDPADRESPIDISGMTLSGDALDLSDYRGEVVVLNVWWSGCGPCRAEAPTLANVSALQEAVQFVGINTRDASTDAAKAFEAEFDVTYPSLYDPSGETLLNLGAYEPSSPPSTLVLDRDGRVAALISGPIPSERTLVDVLDEVTSEDG